MQKWILCQTLMFFIGMPISVAWAELEDKKQYHVFNPTPKALLREMSTDRPDKTESAYTVDAGHYQIELSFLDHVIDRHNSEGSQVETETFGVMPANFKVGLLNNIDFQLVVSPYIEERTQEDGEESTKRGFGDIQTRLKINVWGNDGGKTALALMPFIKFPTNGNDLSNDAVEGGLIVPFALELPAGYVSEKSIRVGDKVLEN